MNPAETATQFGYPNYRGATPAPARAPAEPTPVHHRPKGRWFIGILLVAACGWGGYQVWDSFFRYRAYGTVEGRVVRVPAPHAGVLVEFHVHEGEVVRQGQLLVMVENAALRHRYQQLDDEIKQAQASLDAETARLKWQAAFHLDQSHAASARYLESVGNFRAEQANLQKLLAERARAENLYVKKALAEAELDRICIETLGQQKKVEKLQESLRAMKKHKELATILLAGDVDLGESLAKDGDDQLKPHLAKIAYLSAERARVKEQLDRGRVLASGPGRVLKIHHFAGEHCPEGEPVISLLEEGSLRAVVFVPQSMTENFNVGDAVALCVEPYPNRMTATVDGWGQQFEAAPEHLKRYSAAGQKFLPLYLSPQAESAQWMALRIGGVVKLP
ncbi:MAG: hypothetical protein HY040_21205 [Planctomycetes bacterium]|nr:hypothetical protein [Planctomycetota bacterium]